MVITLEGDGDNAGKAMVITLEGDGNHVVRRRESRGKATGITWQGDAQNSGHYGDAAGSVGAQ